MKKSGKIATSVLKATVLFALAIAFENCSKVNFSKPQTTNNQAPFVCDPFGGGGGTTGGLKGDLYYYETAPAGAYTKGVGDYFTEGQKHDAHIIMSQLNIPTKPWSIGFQTSSGETVKKLDGTTLFEWFAVKLRTQIKLAEGNSEGQYQFGILSDDGSIVRLNDSTQQVLINNDGVTMTRFAFANQPVSFTNETHLPIQIEYFQGPRYHISLILMWRPWNGNASDPAGGVSGNDLYFNSSATPPTPQSAYTALLSRGWRPLVTNNYVLPNNETNPCN